MMLAIYEIEDKEKKYEEYLVEKDKPVRFVFKQLFKGNNPINVKD